MSLLGLFVIGFISVFSLAFQSRNINHGNYGWAAGGSFVIGFSQAAIWTQITAPTAGFIEAAVYSFSGTCAVVSSMWVHERFIKRKPIP